MRPDLRLNALQEIGVGRADALRLLEAIAPQRDNGGQPSSTLASTASSSRRPASFTAVYINLAHRADRRAAVESTLARAGLAAAERLEACTDADAPDAVVTRTWDSTLNAQFDLGRPCRALQMTPGERGCAMSHVRAWRRAAAAPADGPPLLVLEDDVVLAFGAGVPGRCAALLGACVAAVEAELAEPRERALLLYLGAHVVSWRTDGFTLRGKRAAMAVDAAALPVCAAEAEYLFQTHAYLLWPAAAAALLAALPVDAPVDDFLSRQVLERRVSALVLQPELLAQAAPYRNGDIEHSKHARAELDEMLWGPVYS